MSPAEILYARETSICYALDNVVLIYSKAAKLIFAKTREISCIVFLYGETSFRGTLLVLPHLIFSVVVEQLPSNSCLLGTLRI